MEDVKIIKIEKLGEKAYPIKGLASIQYGNAILQGFKIIDTEETLFVLSPSETIREGEAILKVRSINFPKSLWDKIRRAILIAWEEQKNDK